jgi:hypothetical protein
MTFIAKCFIIAAGIWNIVDGILSLRTKSLRHTVFWDACRLIRTLLGLGLVVFGFLI